MEYYTLLWVGVEEVGVLQIVVREIVVEEVRIEEVGVLQIGVGEIVVLQVGLLVPMCRVAFGLAPNSWFLLGPRDRKRTLTNPCTVYG